MDAPGTSPCSKCREPAVTDIPYAGTRLCRDHFIRFFRERVSAELRHQLDVHTRPVVAIGVSGGKDSTALAHVLQGILGRDRRVTLQAVAVDEGIPGYRDRSLEVAKRSMKAIGIPLTVVRMESVTGYTTNDAARLMPEQAPCAACGVFRRAALNDAARQLGATHVATGHNLDDMAQTILMNVLRADVESLGRLGPHDSAPDGLVPRILPVRSIPEREVALYAILHGLEVCWDECPHAVRSGRGRIRDVIATLCEDDPAARHRLLQFAESLRRASPVEAGRCSRCGGASARDVCRVCHLQEELAQRAAASPAARGL